MKRTLIIAVIALFGALAVSPTAKEPEKPAAVPQGQTKAADVPKVEASGLTWYSYPEGLKKARAENKHLMIHFTATWCGWCKKMEKETYTDSSVMRTLSHDFVLSKVWGDTDSLLDIDGYQISERGLSQTQFGVRSFPTLAFVEPSGKNLGSLPGYRPAPELLKILEYVRDYKYDTTRTKQQTEQKADSAVTDSAATSNK